MTSELKAWPPKQIEMLAARHRIIYQTRADFVAALNEYAASRRAPSPAVARLVEACKGLLPTLDSGDWGNQEETANGLREALAAVEKEM